MCLAVPALIIEIHEDRSALVDIMGVSRVIALDLVPLAEVGDYVLVHAGFGIEIVSREAAEETLELLREFPELAADF